MGAARATRHVGVEARHGVGVPFLHLRGEQRVEQEAALRARTRKEAGPKVSHGERTWKHCTAAAAAVATPGRAPSHRVDEGGGAELLRHVAGEQNGRGAERALEVDRKVLRCERGGKRGGQRVNRIALAES